LEPPPEIKITMFFIPERIMTLTTSSPPAAPLDSDSTAGRIERPEAEVALLRDTVQKLCAELGVSPLKENPGEST